MINNWQFLFFTHIHYCFQIVYMNHLKIKEEAQKSMSKRFREVSKIYSILSVSVGILYLCLFEMNHNVRYQLSSGSNISNRP